MPPNFSAVCEELRDYEREVEMYSRPPDFLFLHLICFQKEKWISTQEVFFFFFFVLIFPI